MHGSVIDQQYHLAVTNLFIKGEYFAKADGDHAVGPAILCLSLSEPIHDRAFKLIATVIIKERVESI